MGKMLELLCWTRTRETQSRTCTTYMALENKPGYGAQWTSEMKLCYLDLHVWQLNQSASQPENEAFTMFKWMNRLLWTQASFLFKRTEWLFLSVHLLCHVFSCLGLKLPLNITQASMNSFNPFFFLNCWSFFNFHHRNLSSTIGHKWLSGHDYCYSKSSFGGESVFISHDACVHKLCIPPLLQAAPHLFLFYQLVTLWPLISLPAFSKWRDSGWATWAAAKTECY